MTWPLYLISVMSQTFPLKIKMYWSRSFPYSLKVTFITFIYYCTAFGLREFFKNCEELIVSFDTVLHDTRVPTDLQKRVLQGSNNPFPCMHFLSG